MKTCTRFHTLTFLCLLFLTLLCRENLNAKETLVATNLPPPRITLTDFQLVGDLVGDRASFSLSALANVEDRQGGSVELLAGPVALTEVTEVGPHPQWELRAEQGRYHRGVRSGGGKYPVTLKFNCCGATERRLERCGLSRGAERAASRWCCRAWRRTRSLSLPARPAPSGSAATSSVTFRLDGAVRLSWQGARKEEEGKLFYAAELLSQVSVSPGLMRQVALLDFKVMQGELGRVTLLLRGAGEVTRVAGDQVLAWNVERACRTADGPPPRGPTQPAAEGLLCKLQVQLQTPLGAFPQTTDAIKPPARRRDAVRRLLPGRE
jgi:hypothetical protein